MIIERNGDINKGENKMNLREAYKSVIRHNLENVDYGFSEKEINRLTGILAYEDDFLIALQEFVEDYLRDYGDDL